jgi:hypothetical protein
LFDSGYKSNLLTPAKNCGFAVPIFPSMIFTKKMADPTYCGPPFFQDLRYLDISQSETMYLNAVFFTQNLNCDFYR